VPKYLYVPRTMDPLAHAVWETETDLVKIIATESNPKAVNEQARKQTWDLVAKRIMRELECG